MLPLRYAFTRFARPVLWAAQGAPISSPPEPAISAGLLIKAGRREYQLTDRGVEYLERISRYSPVAQKALEVYQQRSVVVCRKGFFNVMPEGGTKKRGGKPC